MKNLRNTLFALLTLTVVGGGLFGFFAWQQESEATDYNNSNLVDYETVFLTDDTLDMASYGQWDTTYSGLIIRDGDLNEIKVYCGGDGFMEIGKDLNIASDKGYLNTSHLGHSQGLLTSCTGDTNILHSKYYLNLREIDLVHVPDLNVGDTVKYDQALAMLDGEGNYYPNFKSGDNSIESWQVVIDGQNEACYTDIDSHYIEGYSDHFLRFDGFVTISELPEDVDACAGANDTNSIRLMFSEIPFIQTEPTDQVINFGETATFTTGINPVYADTDLEYQWFEVIDTMAVGLISNFTDNGDGSFTSDGDGGQVGVYLDYTKFSVGSVISFDYDLSELPDTDCSSGFNQGFEYFIMFDGDWIKEGMICENGSETIEYVIKAEDFPGAPGDPIFAWLVVDYDMPDGGSLTVNNFAPAAMFEDFIEIDGANSTTLTIDPLSPYYRDEAEFVMFVTDTFDNEEITGYDRDTDEIKPVKLTIVDAVSNLSLNLGGQTSAFVGDTITVSASAEINGVLTDVTNDATFTSIDVATSTPDTVVGNKITFVGASNHLICVNYINRSVCDTISISKRNTTGDIDTGGNSDEPILSAPNTGRRR